jgi:hypothetical protein
MSENYVSPEEKQRAQALAASVKNDNEKAELRAILQGASGRAYLWKLMSWCGVFQSPFCGEAVHATHVSIGKQEVGRKILAEIMEAAPEKYMVMAQEAKERENDERTGKR